METYINEYGNNKFCLIDIQYVGTDLVSVNFADMGIFIIQIFYMVLIFLKKI
jgi:hypothetical protein